MIDIIYQSTIFHNEASGSIQKNQKIQTVEIYNGCMDIEFFISCAPSFLTH